MSNPVIEQSATAGIVDELVKELEALDLKITNLESDLSNAKHQRNGFSHQLQELRAFKTPTRHLPSEVLAMIFENHREDQKERNVALMHVCKMWYKIVMNTPTLWNNIILTLFTIEDLPKIWSYACFCLARSGKALLDVVLNADKFQPVHPFKTMAFTYRKYYDPTDETGHEREISEYLAEAEDLYIDLPEFLGMYQSSLLMTLAILRGQEDRFLSRWRKLSIHVPFALSDEGAYDLWNSIDGATTELTHLRLHGTRGAPEGWEQTGFRNLERLKVFDIGLEVDFSRAAVHLQQLRIITNYSWTSILPLYTYNFLSLTLLHVSISHNARNFELNGRISLPALQALAVEEAAGTFTILQQIEAPTLTYLSLACRDIAEFTSCSLLNTVTDLLWDCDYGLESLLEVTPALERIHLPDGFLDEYFREVLDAGGSLMVEGRGPVHCAGDCTGWPYVYPLESDQLHSTIDPADL